MRIRNYMQVFPLRAGFKKARAALILNLPVDVR